MIRTQEDMQRRILQRDQRSDTLTKQLAAAEQKAAKREAEQAAAKERADANEKHMQRLSAVHGLLSKSHARIRAGAAKAESISVAHLDALERLEASKEQTASARAEVARAEATLQATRDTLHAERARRELSDDRLERSRHEALTQQQVLAAAQSEAAQSKARQMEAGRERERVSRQLEIASARLSDALVSVKEEQAMRTHEGERAAAREASLQAECATAKQATLTATAQWEQAAQEAAATRAELHACRSQLEEVERGQCLYRGRYESLEGQLREAQAEIEWLEGERRKLVAENGDVSCQNVRLEIELQGRQRTATDARLLTMQ